MTFVFANQRISHLPTSKAIGSWNCLVPRCKQAGTRISPAAILRIEDGESFACLLCPCYPTRRYLTGESLWNLKESMLHLLAFASKTKRLKQRPDLILACSECEAVCKTCWPLPLHWYFFFNQPWLAPNSLVATPVLICDAPQLEHPLGEVNQASRLAGQKGGSFTALFTGAGRMLSFSKESEAPLWYVF